MTTHENTICSRADRPVVVPVNGDFEVQRRIKVLNQAGDSFRELFRGKGGVNIRCIPLLFQSLAWFTEALNEFKKTP
jgi:hypothetical protein